MVSRIEAVASSLLRSQRAMLPAPTSVTVGSGATSAWMVRGGDACSAFRGSVASRQVANKAPTARTVRTARGARRVWAPGCRGRLSAEGSSMQGHVACAQRRRENALVACLLRSVAAGTAGWLWHLAYSY